MTETIIIPGVAEDGTLYPIEKLEAHRRGVLHLAISAFVFSGEHLLIQQRAGGKYHSGGQWANTCCSHPNWDEDPLACAERRLGEELGISVKLAPSGMVEYRADVGADLIEHERVHMFRGEADRRQLTITPNPDEVADTRWVRPADLRDEMATMPEAFTPWFRLYIEQWADLWLPAA